jgi:hypothetical protein
MKLGRPLWRVGGMQGPFLLVTRHVPPQQCLRKTEGRQSRQDRGVFIHSDLQPPSCCGSSLPANAFLPTAVVRERADHNGFDRINRINRMAG